MNGRFHYRRIGGALLVLALSLGGARAITRAPYLDDVMVPSSGWIVIGHTVGSFKKIPTGDLATLVITEVLKGDAKPGMTQVIFSPDVVPMILKTSDPDQSYEENTSPADESRDLKSGVGLQDQTMTLDIPTSTTDIRQDEIWFLNSTGKDGKTEFARTGTVMVFVPEQVKPLAMKPYYLAMLSTNPLASLKTVAETNPALAAQALDMRDCLALAKIAGIADLNDRYDRVLPYFLKLRPNNPIESSHKVYDLMETRDPKLLKKLIPIFLDPKYQYKDFDILSLWSRSRFDEATSVVVEWLKKEDAVWDGHDMRDMSWRKTSGTDADEGRNPLAFSYLGMCQAIYFLYSVHGVDGKEIIEKIRNRWAGLDPKDGQMLCKACDRVLASFK